METVSAALARTAVFSVAMLLTAGTLTSAAEFATRGAGGPTRSDVGAHAAVAQTRYGSVYPGIDAYAYAGYAYAGRGYMENEYSCQSSPASLGHVPCDK